MSYKVQTVLKVGPDDEFTITYGGGIATLMIDEQTIDLTTEKIEDLIAALRIARAHVSGPRVRKYSVSPGGPRGFAALKAQGREEELVTIASRGGSAAHLLGTAHEFTTEEAKEAGSKGGKASAEKRRRR